MSYLKKLFCRHKKSEVVCWHWTHGPNGNDIRFLEIQRKCPDCGKYFFRYIKNWDECEKFISKELDIKTLDILESTSSVDEACVLLSDRIRKRLLEENTDDAN